MKRGNNSRAQPTLSRSIGRLQAAGLTVGAIIGAGIFGTTGPATESAGTGVLLSISLAGLVSIASGISGVQAGAAYPEPGGAFIWTRNVGLTRTAFIAGCCFVAKEIIGLGFIALTFALYLSLAIPGAPLRFVAAGIALAVTALNYFGVSPTATVMAIAAAVKVLLLLTFAAAVMHAVDPHALLPVLGNGPIGVLQGAALFFFSFDGFVRAAVIAGEIKEPRKTLPFAVVTGSIVGFVVFIAVVAATLGSLGAQATASDKVPVFTTAVKAIGTWGEWIILAAALVATSSVLVGGVLATSRVALAMAKAGELPSWLSVIHPKYRVPHRTVVGVGLAVAAISMTFDLRPLLETSNAFCLVWFAIMNVDALRLTKEQRFASPLISWAGLIGCLVFLVMLPITSLIVAAATLALLLGVRQLVAPRGKSRTAPH